MELHKRAYVGYNYCNWWGWDTGTNGIQLSLLGQRYKRCIQLRITSGTQVQVVYKYHFWDKGTSGVKLSLLGQRYKWCTTTYHFWDTGTSGVQISLLGQRYKQCKTVTSGIQVQMVHMYVLLGQRYKRCTANSSGNTGTMSV